MPRFFFDFHQGSKITADASGVEFPDVEQAYLEVFKAGQDMWGELLKLRQDPRRCHFEVRSETGEVLFAFPLREVLESCHDRIADHYVLETLRQLAETHQQAQRLKEEFAAEIELSRVVLKDSHKILRTRTGPD